MRRITRRTSWLKASYRRRLCRSPPGCRAAQKGRARFRLWRRCSRQQQQPRPYVAEGIDAIPGRKHKEFLGTGDFGCVTVLSPDPKSGFPIWETASRSETRECSFMGVVELDSDYYGFMIEHGVCSNDIWSADHEFAYEDRERRLRRFL